MSFQKNVQKLTKLYSIIEDVDNTRAEGLYRDGKRAKRYDETKFPFKRYFENILRLDVTGQWIWRAMVDNWPGIDKAKGVNTIIEKGTPEYVFRVGVSLPDLFDFEKGMQTLFTRKQENGWWIFHAGSDWKKFDYKRGLDAIIAQDKDGETIYRAGSLWKNFDYQKALAALKKIAERYPTNMGNYYDTALKYWPKGTVEIIQQSKEMRSSAKKMPKTPFKLKESAIEPVDDDYIIKAFATKNFFPMHSQNLKIILLRNGWSLWQGKIFVAYVPKDNPTHVYLNRENPLYKELLKHSKFSMNWSSTQTLMKRKAEE